MAAGGVAPRNPAAAGGMALFFSFLALLAGAAEAASIYAVSPARGGLAGGTKVTISGAGFARNGLEGVTRVWIGAKEVRGNPAAD